MGMDLSWLLTNLGFVLGVLLALVVIVHILRRKPSPSGAPIRAACCTYRSS